MARPFDLLVRNAGTLFTADGPEPGTVDQLLGHIRGGAVGIVEAHVAGMKRYLATGISRILGRRLELSAIRKDGVEIPIELVVAATQNEDRPNFVAYMRDLSDQKRTEAALRARGMAVIEDINAQPACGFFGMPNAATDCRRSSTASLTASIS